MGGIIETRSFFFSKRNVRRYTVSSVYILRIYSKCFTCGVSTRKGAVLVMGVPCLRWEPRARPEFQNRQIKRSLFAIKNTLLSSDSFEERRHHHTCKVPSSSIHSNVLVEDHGPSTWQCWFYWNFSSSASNTMLYSLQNRNFIKAWSILHHDSHSL